MRLFAFFLPQFHSIPENDEWWGEGFTEWTNVKKAMPLFKRHTQPIHPLNDYYYNLLDLSTIRWQTDLMNQYRIDGFIYYHYYFEGKLLLEKPAEILLKNKDINQNFFFCWANHSWKRSWEGKSTVLIEQTYGDIEAWEAHFQYLLPFFKDERYEKKDNKPLFMFFFPFFKEKNEIVSYFDKRCKEVGFDGISIIDSIQNTYTAEYSFYCSHPSNYTNYIFFREPGVCQQRVRKKHPFVSLVKRFRAFLNKKYQIGNYVFTYNGDSILKTSLKSKYNDTKILRGLFFEWDNTPRHGQRGYIIKPISRRMFSKFMDSCSQQDYIFVNAWNEWCEGMILEPTKEKEYTYLEWIKEYRERNNL